MAPPEKDRQDEQYRCLVVDSGPIIKLTGFSDLWKKADTLYTVPAVLQEIRDAKARQHLETLPYELKVRDASPEGIQAVAEFARKTGDYNSLSSVDLQVLGLLYDLEQEGCMDMSHVRTNPKRVVGLGKIESLTKEEEKQEVASSEENPVPLTASAQHRPQNEMSPVRADNNQNPTTTGLATPKTWAALVSPMPSSDVTTSVSHISIYDDGNQFSDAEEEGDEDTLQSKSESNIEKELQCDFPSLAATLTVPYEGSDNEADDQDKSTANPGDETTKEKERMRQSLKPVSKSGKLYNSFSKYGHLMKPKPKVKNAVPEEKIDQDALTNDSVSADVKSPHDESNEQSRIVGGMALGGQDDDVDDDGEGWITCTKDISSMKSAGLLDPKCTPEHLERSEQPQLSGPPLSERTACATTDFAMQNVILQMNLELLSVDGMKIRKLKSWVTRCGACYKVYTNSDDTGPLGKRLFCGHCGSDMMQRIAASVDGKTGRLRLHLSKKYKHNLRGTKFSLPKPGNGDRFQGDLLLREDQLLMGAWNQKVKMRSGGKAKQAAQSMFGRDIASNVGCHSNSMNGDDIRPGFGRRNPNAAKGRERRGKKKKTKDKACGLRRY